MVANEHLQPCYRPLSLPKDIFYPNLKWAGTESCLEILKGSDGLFEMLLWEYADSKMKRSMQALDGAPSLLICVIPCLSFQNLTKKIFLGP